LAYSNNPQFSTYKQETIKFDATPFYRIGELAERDAQIVNMYYDRVSEENKERETILKKRPGLTATTYSLSKSAASSRLRGSFYDTDQNTWYWAVNNKVYSVSPDVGTTVRTVTTLAGSTGYVGFCSFLKSDGTRYVVFSDGAELWVDNYAATTCVLATAGYPTPHHPCPTYLNGYIFLIEEDTSNIWNSDNDDPTAWTAGSFITAEIHSDKALRLLKAKNYLICLGVESSEYFWDAGNTGGSPLERNDSPVRSVGFVSNLCTIGDTTFFVGQDGKQGLAVFEVNSFKIEPVSNPVVNRSLQPYTYTQNDKSQAALDHDGFSIAMDGHTFYVLVTETTTWLYDIDTKIWYEWRGSDNTGLKVEAAFTMFNGGCYVAIEDQTTLSMFSQTKYQDFGTNFTCQYTTEDYTSGTMNWKVINRAHLVCSRHLNSTTSSATLQYSPDDWSPSGVVGTRQIDVFSNSPFATRLGRYRNISFRIKYADNYPFFMSQLILDMNVMGN